MRFWCKSERARLAPTTNFYIIVFRSTHRYTLMRNVRDIHGQIFDFCFKLTNLIIQFFDPVAYLTHFSNQFICIFFILLPLSHFSRYSITAIFQRLALLKQFPTFLIQFRKVSDKIKRFAATFQRLFDLSIIITQYFDI
ncbi:hypothetical protein D3C73_929100 [compost metagenome]